MESPSSTPSTTTTTTTTGYPQSSKSIINSPSQSNRLPPPPPPRKRAGSAVSGNACLQQIGMGMMMGGLVGSSMGLLGGLVGGYMSNLRGKSLLMYTGGSVLKMTGFFGGIMSIGSALRCEELDIEQININNNKLYTFKQPNTYLLPLSSSKSNLNTL
ncbi:reactive oxygen species modulator [Heterostelium album PN500]|uniref:Reactive oxygen species modulator n=1 Tax=Heterostelium pallidum (strain ATCC 26659 / Pp 5 / PN500) TaxID=670386 RepID=D3BTP7_HETP5|nr:reactive oxygen species modulator [Heterostelium album PN500]EFA75083.1 reactive oxygen species modulator [Heterostelium album PN500]|eukprot:XP_020427217.1 reactive oxygen species modulator [Heterostelium album PN500]